MDASYLSSYLPRLVRRQLSRSSPDISKPIEMSHAAVLLTDMQGFTRKVEDAAAGGRRHLDLFTRALDQYFCDLIDVVHAHGGDVLAFAGDSMLCVWPCASIDPLHAATLTAAEAGMQIQKRLAGRELTRVGLGAGPIACTLAGGLGGRWELFVTGEAVSGAAEAERLGLPGQLVLSPAAWKLIERDASGTLLANGCYVLDQLQVSTPPASAPTSPEERLLDASTLLPMVPAVVMHHVSADQVAWLAEVRPVTVMVVGMPGLDVSAPEGLLQTQRAIRVIQDIFHEFDGSPRCVIDGKGHLIGGDFGLPPASPERHAERAVRAARRVHSAMTDLGIGCAIGVATARAFCTGFGNERRRDFGVFGDATIVATRLMQAARNEVWCDELTARGAASRIAFTALPSLAVKGRDQAVRVFRPTASAAAAAESIPAKLIVGREADQAFLADQVRALLQQGRGGVVVIDGEAGSGKSVLLAEARRLAAATNGLRVVHGEADVVDRASPYLAWQPVFRQLLDIAADTQGETVPRHVVERFPEAQGILDYLPLLGPTLGLSIPDTLRTRAMTGDVRAANTHRTMLTVLRYFAGRAPLLITIEDAHWLDSGSTGFLRWLARRPGATLTLVSSRPEQPFFDQFRAGLKGPQVHGLSLGEMPHRELLALARRMLGVDHLPAALEQLLHQSVGGNPYFCSELIRALQDDGRIRVNQGRCEVFELGAGDVPATVESAILGRLARLAPAEQLCLKTASVLGPSFHEETLQAIHPVYAERGQVAERLAPAENGGLIALETPQPDRSWVFRHALVRDATYALWTQTQREPLHRAVAQWYEARFAVDLAPLSALLAHHWDQAGDASTAARYLERAGERALRGGNYQEARRLFGRLLELLHEGQLDGPASRRARWYGGAGMAHYYLGELGSSQQQLETVVALLDRPIPAEIGSIRRRMLGSVLEQALHRLLPRRFSGRRAQEQADIETAVECYSKLSQIYYLNGEPTERLLAVTLGGLNLAEQGRPSAALARVLSGSAILAALAGMDPLADHYARRAHDIVAQPDHREAAAQVWHFHALLCAQRGHWAAARDASDRALELIRELDDQTLEAEACVVRSTFLLCQSRYHEAEPAWSRGLHLARRAGNLQLECWCLLDESETHLGRGDLVSAARALEQALEIPTQAADGYSTLEKNRMLALLRLRQDRPAEALAACDEVRRRVHSQPPAGYHWADFYASAVEVVLRLLERDGMYSQQHRRELLDRAREGVRRLTRLGRRFGNVRVRAVILAGLLDAIEQSGERALRRWREAVDLAQTLDMPGERCRALIELAAHGHPPPAPGAIEQAAAWLRENGAVELLRRLEAHSEPEMLSSAA